LAKFKSLIIFLGIFLLIGIIHGVILDSVNVFISWVLIGIWIIITFKVFKNVKQYREFNSPHNTAFFTILPVFTGIFYSIWGNFTGLLGENLLENTDLYLSLWSLILGFPYVVYGSLSLYRCFKKYNVIYFGKKSIKARTFGYILGILIFCFIIIYWISFYLIIDFYKSFLTPLHFSIDLNLLLLLISTILIIIIPGLANTQTQLPRLTRDYITRRTNRLNNLTTPTINSTSFTSRSINQSHSSRPRSTRVNSTTKSKAIRRISTEKPTMRSKKTTKLKNLNLYRPKAGNLSVEDFKCIFCFKLPEFPKDKGRGIILCPNCRYPAHADEFKDWLRSSNLCSRCNAPIPTSFRRNPKVISVKNYVMIYRNFLKK
jgi:hypothetical protein